MILSWETGWWVMAKHSSEAKKEAREHSHRQSGGPTGRFRRPKERAKDVGGTLLRIWGYMKRQKGALAITALLVVVKAGLGTLGPYLMGRTIDSTINTGDLVGILTKEDATKVMESIYRLSDEKMFNVETLVNRDADIDRAVRCGYLKAADIADRFGGTPIDPGLDTEIVSDNGGIFTSAQFTAGDRDAREFQKTASVMKLVMNGFAGAGCVEMGGYDYHGGRRAEGEVKDFRAGQCMGACLEYAARLNKPLMLYVFSDGSLSSNGALDTTTEGRGKGEWVSDNSSTAGSFFLVYNPPTNGGRPTLLGNTLEEQAMHQQLGYMTADGSVQRSATPMANNVNLLVNSVVLNYMALHGEQGQLDALYQSLGISHGLGSDLDSLTAFAPIVNGIIPP